ncbi:MAG: YfhO family protein, partial [Anaerolineales bacterium]
GLTWQSACLAALVFALGGHLSSKVEQVNQLQGLAWMPWLLLAWDRLLRGNNRLRAGLALSILLALQLTAGHAQTTFISLVGLGVWWLVAPAKRSIRQIVYPAAFVLAGALLAAAQLLPTLELLQHSFRSGGLPFSEALSFSLNPLLLGRALLPGYSRAVFSEFLGYLGVVPLVLAVGGVLQLRQAKSMEEFAVWRAVALLALVGMLLALGGFNPVYWALVRVAPGFDLFRAPARWLALWALGSALLAGRGLDLAGGATWRGQTIAAGIVLGLIGLTFVSAHLVPPGESGALGRPGVADLAGWIGALIVGSALILRRARNLQPPISNLLIIGLSLAELLLASLQLPLNNLTTPEAYRSIRPAMTQLLATRADALPPARFLSMSALIFDPGDLTEMRDTLAPQLPENAVFDAIVAAKAKEVLSPNLPLVWDVPAVDGYDGGVLPLRAYAQFAEQFTGEAASPDGRLREFVTATPPNWLLNITNTRWLITDKVADLWNDDVYYDLQFEYRLGPGESVSVGDMPSFTATTVGLVHAGGPGHLDLELDSGERRRIPIPKAGPASAMQRVPLGDALRAVRLSLVSESPDFVVRGAALVDERTDAFQPLTLGPYRLAHNGDVKVYENLNVFPRAFVVPALPLTPDSQLLGSASVQVYESDHVDVRVDAPRDGYLVLADAYYPGWRARVDGDPAVIETANAFFRAIPVTAGRHAVVFSFEPASWRVGVGISALALLGWAGLAMAAGRRHPSRGAKSTGAGP